MRLACCRACSLADPLQRLSVSQVLQHPWTSQGLGPAPTAFNDAEVAASLAHPPPPEVSAALGPLGGRCILVSTAAAVARLPVGGGCVAQPATLGSFPGCDRCGAHSR